MIGSGGKVIREITETTGAKIDIDDDGTVKVAAVDGDAAKAAIDWIRGIVAEPEVGVIYNGKVVKVVDFGAFVNFLGSRDGLVHISELAPQRVGKVADVVKLGDHGQGQGARLRRPRQSQAEHAPGRPGDRRGSRLAPAESSQEPAGEGGNLTTLVPGGTAAELPAGVAFGPADVPDMTGGAGDCAGCMRP